MRRHAGERVQLARRNTSAHVLSPATAPPSAWRGDVTLRGEAGGVLYTLNPQPDTHMYAPRPPNVAQNRREDKRPTKAEGSEGGRRGKRGRGEGRKEEMSFTGLLVDGDDGETHHTRQHTSAYLPAYVPAYVSKSCSGLRVEGDDGEGTDGREPSERALIKPLCLQH